MAVKPIPDGYHSVTPYLMVHDGAAALDFYKKAFGAVELFRFPMPDGKIGHAEFKIGDSPVMLADDQPGALTKGPRSLGGAGVGMLIYLPDVDAAFAKAIGAGGKVLRPVKDQFYGDRSGSLEDPFGHNWTIATHKEDVTKEEMDRRMAEMMKGG
jgi:PhnB protein